MPQQAFLFDANKCTGCQACELACTIENDLPGFSWRQVSTLNKTRLPGVPVVHLSLACNHCEDPPCMSACPALAYSKDPETGHVTLDPDLCIGCKYCAWACPYDAPTFDGDAGGMTKCTFCGHRQAEGLAPACVEQCPTGALGFGDLASLPATDSAPGLPEIDAARPDPRPAIRFAPWRSARGAIETCRPDPASLANFGEHPRSKIQLRSEWPLVAFTLLGALLVATFSSSLAAASWTATVAFLCLAAASLVSSSLHLGQKRRAWRAVLNVRRSWLSREVVLYSSFLGLSIAQLLIFRADRGLFWISAICGFAALFAMDRVYDLARPRELRPLHSADVLLTGALWTTLFLGNLPAAILVAALKLALYLFRKNRLVPKTHYPAKWWTAARLFSGFAVPVAAGLIGRESWPLWAFLGTAFGELIDRCELYTELEIPTPRRQMALELERRLQA